jgi:hypothetical protein
LAALKLLGCHPEIIQRQDALLWSINERLGQLCGTGGGLSLQPLGSAWLAESLAAMAKEERE